MTKSMRLPASRKYIIPEGFPSRIMEGWLARGYPQCAYEFLCAIALHMSSATFTLYLDESGDNLLHTVEDYSNNPQMETHCTLVGVIVGHNKKALMNDGLNKIKENIWRTKSVVLHSVDMRFKRGIFALFHYRPELYEQFKAEMNRLTTLIEPIIICSSLNKKLWVEKYPRKLFFQDCPYEQAFEYLLERYAHFLNKQPHLEVRGRIMVECRTPQQDSSLQKTLERVLKVGTQYFQDINHFSKIVGPIEFHPKEFNIQGLQLSDYFCYPFYKNHKFPDRENVHYDFLEKFVYPGEYARYGHKKFPI